MSNLHHGIESLFGTRDFDFQREDLDAVFPFGRLDAERHVARRGPSRREQRSDVEACHGFSHRRNSPLYRRGGTGMVGFLVFGSMGLAIDWRSASALFVPSVRFAE
jgi:hypothetical protein